MKTALGLVYFYIDVVKNEIKEKESLSDTDLITHHIRLGGEISVLRIMLSRLNVIATTLEADKTDAQIDKLIEVVIGDEKQDTMMFEDAMGREE